MATRDRPTVGLDHVTVVPTNFERQGSAEDPPRGGSGEAGDDSPQDEAAADPPRDEARDDR